MKIIKTIIDNLPGHKCGHTKMERKLDLLETCSSRSHETHPYFLEDNIKQNKFYC